MADATAETFPKASWLCTVTAAEHTPACLVCTGVVNTRWSAAAGVTVSPWVAWLSGGEEALTVGVPALLLLK